MKPATRPQPRAVAPLSEKFKEDVLLSLSQKDIPGARRLLAPIARGYMERGDDMPQDLQELLALYLATDMLNPDPA